MVDITMLLLALEVLVAELMEELQVVIGPGPAQLCQCSTQPLAAVAIEVIGRPVDRAQYGRDARRSNLAAPPDVLPDTIEMEEVNDVEAIEVGAPGRVHLDDYIALLERGRSLQDLGGIAPRTGLQVGPS